ncbi:hypothetical protein B0H13DRAFT_1873120 [Mycena leptocephala]|nr:hypothetical protein B0H13DRAFT_1873120 [Mycena leptocephala]
MTALWRAACLGYGASLEQYQTVLEAVTSSQCLTRSTPAFIAAHRNSDPGYPRQLRDLPANHLRSHCGGKNALLAEFLDRCSADFTPYKAVETIYYIGNSVVPRGAVHEIHQLRLADSFYGRQAYIQSDNQHDLEVLAAAISSGIFELYAGLADSDSNLGQFERGTRGSRFQSLEIFWRRGWGVSLLLSPTWAVWVRLRVTGARRQARGVEPQFERDGNNFRERDLYEGGNDCKAHKTANSEEMTPGGVSQGMADDDWGALKDRSRPEALHLNLT